MDMLEMVLQAPNIEILNSILTTKRHIDEANKVLCAISGGSDSDIVLDLCANLDSDKKVKYVFFDTGLEFQTTKQHLKDLARKYGVEIETKRAAKSIPLCVKEYGAPFLSKQVSEFISRLQRYNFKWEDRGFDELAQKYPKCLAALRWWCNAFEERSRFNISNNRLLKEFMIENPPNFRISNKCCYYAKKLVAKNAIKDGCYDLNVTGVRKAEGGARATAYKGCFTPSKDGKAAEYRPVFWFTKDTKDAFKKKYAIAYSACYEIWGLPRTGCSGCPYAKDFEFELEKVQQFEPKLYIALLNIFHDSYEYTRKYRKYRERLKTRRV